MSNTPAIAGRRRLSQGLWLGLVALALLSAPAVAQNSYREYEDGARDELSDEDIRRLSIDRNRSAADDIYDEERYDEAPTYDDEAYDESYSRGGGSLTDGDVGDVSYFYEELENDGRWFEHEDYGYVWTPYRIASDWRPYTRGRWVMTDAHGWFWVSDEPFGWATYHYGRWFHDRRHGWVWVPGTRWGPAWVAWRDSDDYIGWAPLPPDAYWEPRSSTVVFRETLYEGPQFAMYWSFLAPAYFTAPDPWRHCAPRHRVQYIVGRSRPHTHYGWRNRSIYNAGIPVQRIERATRRPVPRHQAAFRQTRPSRTATSTLGQRNAFEVYRPNLTRQTVEPRRKGRDIPGVVRRNGNNKTVTSSPYRMWRDVDRRSPALAPKRGNGERRQALSHDRKAPPSLDRPGSALPAIAPHSTARPNAAVRKNAPATVDPRKERFRGLREQNAKHPPETKNRGTAAQSPKNNKSSKKKSSAKPREAPRTWQPALGQAKKGTAGPPPKGAPAPGDAFRSNVNRLRDGKS